MKEPENNYEALVLALELAITAPNEEKSAKALAIAESVARHMTEIEVMRAKKEAEKNVQESL